jgi:ubiquinone/menaquinone biosynthesis C-methylase UbiE
MDQKGADQLVKEIFPDFKDAGEIYSEFLDQHLKTGAKILNAGCGEQAVAEKFFIRASEVIGIDKIEPERVPTYLDQFIRADLIRLPLPDNYFDLIIAEWVLEHLQKPKVVLNEFKRILKPGGKVVFMTTNISSWLGILSLLTPTFIHKKLKKICLGIQEKNTFPTRYKINTIKKIEKTFSECGYKKVDLKTTDALGYWYFNSKLLKLAAKKAYQRQKRGKIKHRFHIIGVYELQ